MYMMLAVSVRQMEGCSVQIQILALTDQGQELMFTSSPFSQLLLSMCRDSCVVHLRDISDSPTVGTKCLRVVCNAHLPNLQNAE